jgi:uncharacterized glyoxalase superfamily protein PhnB
MTSRSRPVRFVQTRIVTDRVEQAAAFYAALLQTVVPLNDYYVEVPAGDASIGFSEPRFTEWRVCSTPQIILDFESADLDSEFTRLDRIGVEWTLYPTRQPWGSRSMMLRSPCGVLINVFSREQLPRDGKNGA